VKQLGEANAIVKEKVKSLKDVSTQVSQSDTGNGVVAYYHLSLPCIFHHGVRCGPLDSFL
jgi:hypothetical protein